ncbi:RNA polymerase sigma factor [candidate division KSB1 bacterium]
MISEEKIIEGCIANKRSAQKILFKKFNATMLGLCLRYCKNLEEAEDVMMEGFMTVFTKIEDYKKEGSFEGWIKRIMINTAINNYRSNLKHYYHADVDDYENQYAAHNMIAETIDAEEILKHIQQMPEGYRMVFNLYAIEGYAHKEIANMLGITVSTSKSQLSKARKYIQNQIKNIL